MQRANDARIDEMAALPFEGKMAELRDKLLAMRAKQQEIVQVVTDKKDVAFHDLVARNLVEMETYIFVGFLLLRDALKSEERFAIAERYILDNELEYNKRFARIMAGDVKLIDNKRDIIDY